MKTALLLLFVCLTIFCTTSLGVRSRSKGPCHLKNKPKNNWMQIRNDADCRPVPLPVQLKVPKGFERVSPPVVFVKQCDENLNVYCPNMRCMPVHDKTTRHKVEVKAYKSINTKCSSIRSIEVEEHHACECRCPGKEMCNDKQHFNEPMCRCDCLPSVQDKCHKWLTMYKSSRHMWHDDTCECKCNNIKDCGTGEYFSDIACRCEKI